MARNAPQKSGEKSNGHLPEMLAEEALGVANAPWRTRRREPDVESQSSKRIWQRNGGKGMKTKKSLSPFLCLHSFAQNSAAPPRGASGTASLAANVHRTVVRIAWPHAAQFRRSGFLQSAVKECDLGFASFSAVRAYVNTVLCANGEAAYTPRSRCATALPISAPPKKKQPAEPRSSAGRRRRELAYFAAAAASAAGAGAEVGAGAAEAAAATFSALPPTTRSSFSLTAVAPLPRRLRR